MCSASSVMSTWLLAQHPNKQETKLLLLLLLLMLISDSALHLFAVSVHFGSLCIV